MNVKEFQKKTGYFFKNESLLIEAFSHSSYANEKGTQSYERLEFVGDAIVDFLVGEYLYKNFPDMSEGAMSKTRASLVCEEYLAKLALDLKIDECVLLGHGAEQTGGRKKQSILSDVFEAHIAAIYFDAGLDNVRDYLFAIYGKSIDEMVKKGDTDDYKTKLQELLQKNGSCNIVYEIVNEEGPTHDCVFTVSVSANGKVLGTGSAKSKKGAQQNAAADALKKIEE